MRRLRLIRESSPGRTGIDKRKLQLADTDALVCEQTAPQQAGQAAGEGVAEGANVAAHSDGVDGSQHHARVRAHGRGLGERGVAHHLHKDDCRPDVRAGQRAQECRRHEAHEEDRSGGRRACVREAVRECCDPPPLLEAAN